MQTQQKEGVKEGEMIVNASPSWEIPEYFFFFLIVTEDFPTLLAPSFTSILPIIEFN